MGNMGNLSENMGIFWDLRGFNHIPGFVSSVFWLNVLNGKSAMTGEWITGSFGHALEGLQISKMIKHEACGNGGIGFVFLSF